MQSDTKPKRGAMKYRSTVIGKMLADHPNNTRCVFTSKFAFALALNRKNACIFAEQAKHSIEIIV
jgi:hypothetical protein